VKKEIPVEFIGLSVFKAKGWNVCEGGSDFVFIFIIFIYLLHSSVVVV